jgi:hypothetical protein
MDSHGSVDQTIRAAEKDLDAGNYRGALALLLPLLRAKEKLSAQLFCQHESALSVRQRGLLVVQEAVALAQTVHHLQLLLRRVRVRRSTPVRCRGCAWCIVD